MLIAQITDTHIKLPGQLAYGRVDTAAMLQRCVAELGALDPQPDLIVLTGDLVDFGQPAEYHHLRALLAPLQPPLVAIPGNHDERDAFRSAFADHAHLPATGFLQFSLERPGAAVRLVALDTLVPMEGRGELCASRLAWLDDALAEAPQRPTVVLMHHPPFVTGIDHMDRLGLTGRSEFAEIVARHPQVELILCGHLHRNMQAQVGGRAAMTAPSTAHQVTLNLRENAPSSFRMEPAGYLLHHWHGSGFVTHHANVGPYPGPYPFHDSGGQLID